MNNTSVINKDLSISLCRVLAMLMVVAAHFNNLFNTVSIFGYTISSNVFGEFFSLGVYIFFFISGYLYGNKEIKNKKNWILKRIIRIFVPLYLYLVIYYLFISKEISFCDLIIQLFNLQGLYQIFPSLRFVPGPWFFTVIMIDYFITLVLKKIDFNKYNSYLLFFLGMLILFLFNTVGVNLVGIYVFIIGYISSNCRLKLFEYNNKNVIALLFLFLIGLIIRILFYVYMREISIYDYLIVPLSTIFLTISFVGIIRYAVFKSKGLKTIISSSIFRLIDSISIYVYLFHDRFFFLAKTNSFIQMFYSYLLIVLFTILLSYVLNRIGSIIQDKLLARIEKA